MSRQSAIWHRKGRGFFTTVNNQQIPLGTDRKEARQRFAELSVQGPKPPGRHSVRDLVVEYLQAFADRVASKEASMWTFKSYRASMLSWDEFCAAERVKPIELRAYHVRAWLKANSPDKWNPSTCYTRVGHVKIWIKWVVSQGYLDEDRLSTAKAPTPLRRQPTAPGNFELLAKSIGDPFFLAFFTVLYDSGARPGEISSLTADRVIWDKRAALVTGKTTRKTGARLIGLTRRAVAILREHAPLVGDRPILLTRFGNPWNDCSISRAWNKWAKIAGCVGPFTAYHTRHDLDRRLRAEGVDSVTLSRQLGHTHRGEPHLELLTSTYSHVEAEVLASAVERAALPAEPKPRKRG